MVSSGLVGVAGFQGGFDCSKGTAADTAWLLLLYGESVGEVVLSCAIVIVCRW